MALSSFCFRMLILSFLFPFRSEFSIGNDRRGKQRDVFLPQACVVNVFAGVAGLTRKRSLEGAKIVFGSQQSMKKEIIINLTRTPAKVSVGSDHEGLDLLYLVSRLALHSWC